MRVIQLAGHVPEPYDDDDVDYGHDVGHALHNEKSVPELEPAGQGSEHTKLNAKWGLQVQLGRHHFEGPFRTHESIGTQIIRLLDC